MNNNVKQAQQRTTTTFNVQRATGNGQWATGNGQRGIGEYLFVLQYA